MRRRRHPFVRRDQMPELVSRQARPAQVAEEVVQYAAMSAKQLEKEIQSLEQQMYEYARNLEFEQAAALRNKIRNIKEENLGFSGNMAV